MNINYDPKILQEVKALEQEAVTKTDLNDFGEEFWLKALNRRSSKKDQL